MPTVAELLRQAREEQKLNIYQVAEITKIKTDHIRALEAGQYDAFSAPVYIRGFVRTYAKALRLEKARELVEDTFLRIQEIEVTLGFKDSTRFGKDFKVAYGLTPAKHRVRHRTEAAKHD